MFEQSLLCAGQTRHLTQKIFCKLHNIQSYCYYRSLGPVWNTNECASVIRMKGQKWRKSGTSQPHFTELDNYIFPLLIFPLHYKHLGKKKMNKVCGERSHVWNFFLFFNKLEIWGSLTAEIFSSSVQRKGAGLFPC